MISIIIPVFNEEKTIGEVIDGVKKYVPSGSEILVVNNNSTDMTRDIALSKGIKVIAENEQGKGRAVLAGAKHSNGDILVFIDGDNSYPPESISQLVKPILDGKKEIMIGSRFLGKPITINFLRGVGNKVFTWLASKMYCRTTDLLTGMIAIKKDKFLSLNLKSSGFEIETEVFIKSCKINLRRGEIPISYQERGSKLNPLTDGFKILITLLINKIC